MPRAVPQFESFLSEDETADAFEAHGFVIISGRDARDGRGVALELTPRDARALGAWLLARDAYEAKHFDDSDLDTGD